MPLPNWNAVGSTPNIYHLIELQDVYHRYVMILCAEKGVRIFAINVDALTEELWTTQPELRRRVGSVWAKEQYGSHRFGLTNDSTNEEAMILDQILSGGGHGHLILAGDPLMILKVRSTLPRHLAKLMDIISSSGEHTITNVVAVTLFSLIEYASRESLSTLDELGKEIDADGLAVAGTHACLKALKEGRADTLIMSPIYPPEPGWMCATCGHTDAGGPHIKNRRHHGQPRAASDKQRTPIRLNLESVDREALKKMCGRVPEINRSLRRLKVPFRLKLL